MKSLRYYFRLTIAFVSRFKGLLVIGIIFGIIFYLAYMLISPYFQKKEVRVIGLSGRYYAEDLPADILDMISDGLTSVSNSGTPQPSLASSWETPDQGLTWIFNLSSNYWHDATEVVSEELNYNFSDVDIDRPDEKTIVFKLEEPYSPFPVFVSKPVFKKGLLGTGNWEVEDLTLIQGFVQELVLVDQSENKIRYKFYPNEAQAKVGYKLGEIDELINLYDPSPFDEWDTAQVESNITEDQIVTIFFNTQSDKFKDNKTLRQSLAYALDKTQFSDNRAISPISPNSWAYNPQVKDYLYDSERAIELIEDVPEEEKQRPIILTTTPILLQQAEIVEDYWEEIGLQVEIQVSTSPTEQSHAFLTIMEIPQDPDQYQLWHSTQDSSNISNYASDRIDGLLEQGRVQIDLEQRKRTYIDFQRFLLEDVPAIFLYHPTYYNVLRK